MIVNFFTVRFNLNKGIRICDLSCSPNALFLHQFLTSLTKHMADIFEKLTRHQGPIGQHRERAHGYFAFPKLEGEIGSRMKFRGKEMIVWSLNNYLGLANHPEVRKTDAEGAAKYGLASPMGARMMSGNSNQHEQLEKELSEFVGKEDTALLNYGYQGMVSIIDVLCARHDVIVYDAECHACIIDGLRLHAGHRYVYKHNDLADFENKFSAPMP